MLTVMAAYNKFRGEWCSESAYLLDEVLRGARMRLARKPAATARELLRKKRHPNRQVFMLTDGKPSCLTEEDGRLYKNPFGLDRRVVNKTLEEASWCRRLGIPITTFMLTSDPTLVDFVERFTRTNRGRAYYSGIDRLGAFVLVDYLANRQRRVR